MVLGQTDGELLPERSPISSLIWAYSPFVGLRFAGVYSPNGTFLGVTCVDMELGFLNSILEGLELQRGSSILIVDAETEEIAASFPKLPLLKCNGGTGQDCDGGTLEQVDVAA